VNGERPEGIGQRKDPDRTTTAPVSRPDVILRDVTEPDVEVFFRQQLEPEGIAMAAFPARDRAAHMAHWTKILAVETNVTRTIDAGGQVAGYAGSWVNEHGVREIGYWLGKDHWGKGIATAAIGQFVAVIQERPLHAVVADHNVASIRVLEKCGFTRLGDEPIELPDGIGLLEFGLVTR
jgi:RimJ/RimL family protein N-acetyltransferase